MHAIRCSQLVPVTKKASCLNIKSSFRQTYPPALIFFTYNTADHTFVLTLAYDKGIELTKSLTLGQKYAYT